MPLFVGSIVLKKAIILIFFVLLFSVAAWPVKNKSNPYGGLSFESYCPVIIDRIPSSFLINIFEGFYASLYISPGFAACSIKKLNESNHISNVDMYIYATMYLGSNLFGFPSRPDLQAYFFQKMLHEGDNTPLRNLARMYHEGRGVIKDEQKAKHMLRESFIIYFPVSSNNDNCFQEIDKKTSALRMQQLSEFEEEQIQWLRSLCAMNPEELLKLAEWYLIIENPYRSPRVAEAILANLETAHNQKKVRNLYDDAFREIHK